jgi:hypothetical protein
VWFRSLLILGVLIGCSAAHAQNAKPSWMSLIEAAARRFPQPVRVGDLLHRQVLQPTESQPTLGWVRDVVSAPNGHVDIVVNYGGVFGLFARPIAVPVEGMVLLGKYVEIVDFTPAQLGKFKTFDGFGSVPLPPDSIIRVGLARPSH